MLEFNPEIMVSIRLQRTGRRRQAQFRVVVQDSRFTPTSGRVIANLGFYNPHTKEHGVDLKKASVYLNNGAQPSLRMVRFFVDHKVDLPVWVKKPTQRLKEVKNPDNCDAIDRRLIFKQKVQRRAHLLLMLQKRQRLLSSRLILKKHKHRTSCC